MRYMGFCLLELSVILFAHGLLKAELNGISKKDADVL